MPPANSEHTPARLYEGLMEICRACQRKKGRCKLSRVCDEAYEILSGKTGLELEEIFRKLEDHEPTGREAKPEETRRKRRKSQRNGNRNTTCTRKT